MFVKVGFLKKYIIAEVKGLIEDDDHPYTLTNGKQTNKYLKLLTQEDADDKIKKFKINTISN